MNAASPLSSGIPLFSAQLVFSRHMSSCREQALVMSKSFILILTGTTQFVMKKLPYKLWKIKTKEGFARTSGCRSDVPHPEHNECISSGGSTLTNFEGVSPPPVQFS